MWILTAKHEIGDPFYLGFFATLDEAEAEIERREANHTWPEGYNAVALEVGLTGHNLVFIDGWETV